MSDCEFDCSLTCIHCGYVARKPNTRRMCSVDRPPSVTAQLSSYAAAVSRWLAAGRPVRTDEQVGELLAICQDNKCGKYRDGQCLACGCRVNSSGWALTNKLRMATESCPKGLWAAEMPQMAADRGPVRVGFLAQNLIVGGIEFWMLSLIREWGKTNAVEVSGVAHVGPPGSSSPIVTDKLASMCPLVASYDIPGAHVVRSPVEVAATVASACDVLLTWYSSADILARVKRPGLTLVGVSHGCPDWWPPATKALINKWAAVSQVAATPIRDYSPAVIPLGVDIERCQSSLTREQARERLGLPIGGKVMGYVGRLSPEKRIREIVAAVDHLPDEWRLLVVGDGRDREAVAGPRVIHRPATDAIGDVWRACDAGVVASSDEGYCLAGVECLAAGVPLAATPVGILPEIPGVPIIPQPAEPVAIAAAVERAARLGLTENAKRWAAEQSAEAMATRWAGWLASVRAAS